MSDNSVPAKVRVLSSGTSEWNPARRRGDAPGSDANGLRGNAPDANAAAAAGGEAMRAQGGEANSSLLWMAGAIVLFVIGSAVGGLLVTISLLFPGVL